MSWRLYGDLGLAPLGRSSIGSMWAVADSIAMVSALLVLSTRDTPATHPSVALVPVCLFFFLDAYYLALEKRFRTSYNAFIGQLRSRELSLCSLYAIEPDAKRAAPLLRAMMSLSVWPFYATLLVLVAIVLQIAPCQT